MGPKIRKTKMLVAPVKTVFVDKNGMNDDPWWEAQLETAKFNLATDIFKATLILVPGYKKALLLRQEFRSRAVVLQEPGVPPLTADETRQTMKMGYRDTYLGDQDYDKFISFVATTLNHME